jgi:hypothetical protein
LPGSANAMILRCRQLLLSLFVFSMRGSCFPSYCMIYCDFQDVLDKTNARDALKACGLPSGVKDVEKMAEVLHVQVA